jgi:putative sterol carrier protein
MKTFKFLDENWLIEVERLIKSRITPETINYATTSVLTIFENCPDGTDKALLLKTEKGNLSQIKIPEKPYPQCEFAVSGDYGTFMKVFKGKLDPMTALMGGELHFIGNMIRAMGMISLLEPFFKVLSEIPTDLQ